MSRSDEIIGTVGEVQPDGSAELILTDYGRQLYGPNARLIVTAGRLMNADYPTTSLQPDQPADVPARAYRQS